MGRLGFIAQPYFLWEKNGGEDMAKSIVNTDSGLKVKIGLLGGSAYTAAGSSGEEIYQNLRAICDKISNSKKLKVKIGAAEVQEIKIGDKAIDGFKKRLQSVLNTLKLEGGNVIKIESKDLGTIEGKTKKIAQQTREAAEQAQRFSQYMTGAKLDKSYYGSKVNTISRNRDILGADQQAQYDELIAQWSRYQDILSSVQKSGNIVDGASGLDDAKAKVDALTRSLLEYINTAKNASKEKPIQWSGEEMSAAVAEIDSLTDKIGKNSREWSAAARGPASEYYAKMQSLVPKLRELKEQLQSNSISQDDYNKAIKRIRKELSSYESQITSLGRNHKNIFGKLAEGVKSFFAAFTVARVINMAIQQIRKMISVVKELDDSLTQLQIVTRSSDEEMARYASSVGSTASRIGANTKDLIDATTTYARLGYSMQESGTLAQFTTMLQNVGDIGAQDAQDAITAIIKAYGKNVDDIEDIMNKMVIVGNSAPISVKQIADGMNNAASTLSAAGNTFEQSVAMLTAANTVVQNSSKAATGLRTIVARLRNTKTELDELGETMTTATYEKLITALTKNGVRLRDAVTGDFRSTYDIFSDLSKVWEKMSAIDRSAVATALSGTRQQAIFYSLIGQFDEATKAMDKMRDSAGALDDAYSTYMDSITAHVNQFKAAYDQLAQNLIDKGVVSSIINIGTNILNILNSAVDAIDKIHEKLGIIPDIIKTFGPTLLTIFGNDQMKIAGSAFSLLGSLSQDVGSKKDLGLLHRSSSLKSDAKDVQDYADAIEDVTESLSEASEHWASLGNMDSAIGKVEKLLGELHDGASLSASDVKDLYDSFGSLGSLQTFIDTATNVDSSFEDIHEAANRLIEDFLNSTDITKNMTDAELAATAALLQEMGVVDSLPSIYDKLREARISSTITAQDLTQATSVTTAALLKEAEAAGLNAKMLADLAEINTLVSAKEEARNRHERSLIDDEIRAISKRMTGYTVDLGFTIKVPSSSGSSRSSTTEKYLAELDRYYLIMKRLAVAQKAVADAQGSIDDQRDSINGDLSKIEINERLIDLYKDEASILNELIGARSKDISDTADKLRKLGFVIDYNAEKNELVVQNMEHLNELKGKTTEATNTLIKGTEALIKDMESLNDANQDSANSLAELGKNARSAHESIISLLDDIVSKSNAVVDGFQSFYDTLTTAAKEYASTGYLSVDSLQSILALEPKYLTFLQDENGKLTLNEQALQDVIAARTEDMAVETALAYAKKVLLAAQENDVESLRDLTQVSIQASDATWDMAYATIGLARAIGAKNGMDGGMFDKAVEAVRNMQTIAETSVRTIGAFYRTLRADYVSQADGLNTILDLTKQMIKWENEQQVDALEKQKDQYDDIIDKKKEMLKVSQEQKKHENDLEDKLKKIAKLQAQIDQLRLDDSREATAQRRALETQLAELQNELAESQADYAVDVITESLDKQKEAYDNNLDDKINLLKDELSSEEKLYRAAIERISSGWDSLYDDLLNWNYEVGSSLQDDIINNWNAATEAVQRYGSFVSALAGVQQYTNVSESRSFDDSNGQVTESQVHSVIKEMYANSQEWKGASDERRKWLADRNIYLGNSLQSLGIPAYRDANGVWYVGDEKLFDKYRQYIYHNGGIAGNRPTLKQNEVMAVLKKGEAVLDEQREEGLYKIVNFAEEMSKRFGEGLRLDKFRSLFGGGRAIMPVVPRTDLIQSSGTIAPQINVVINHSGDMSDGDARRYGGIVADSALKGLKDAFSKRGVNDLGTVLLKT